MDVSKPRALWKPLRPWIATATLSATGYLGENPLFVLDYVLRVARVVILLSLWRVILGRPGAAFGMTLPAILTYTLIAEVFAEQLTPRTTLDDALWNGTVVVRFLRPLNTVGQFAAEMAGRWIIGFVFFSLPLLAISPLLGVDPRPANAIAAGLFAASLALGIGVGLAIELIFAAAQIALSLPSWLAGALRGALASLFSGALLPLAVFPAWAGAIFAWLPFASMASAPLRLYTGTGPPAPLLLTQLGWLVALWLLAARWWPASREKITSHEGY